MGTWLPERAEALAFLAQHLKTTNLVRHSLATEAVMRSLARRLGADEELWSLTGLFHDMDLDIVGNDMSRHGVTTAALLSERGFPEEGVRAIVAHNGDELGVAPEGLFQWALIAGETITGFVVACTLVHPSKCVAQVKPSSVRKRMKESRFAANVKRERIECIDRTGLSLDEFIALALAAMIEVKDSIGLQGLEPTSGFEPETC